MRFFRFLRFILTTIFGAVTVAILLLAGAYLYLAPNLPSTESLKDIQLQVPLRVYTNDGLLLAEFGEKRRTPVKYKAVPKQMSNAFLAAEDDRFFSHPGVDYQGLLRAALHLIKTGEKGQGGSTITMQVARNFFLSKEKTFLRKFNEIFLALKIERELSKQEIFELYLNKIYLGHRSYGVQAAAQVYYGSNINGLSISQTAMIAGLPKAPSRFNPIVNPKRALIRRNYVLGRMLKLGFISKEEYKLALAEQITAQLHGLMIEIEAPYVAEMVRSNMIERYGNDAYTAGYQVVTTIDSGHQQAANLALRNALLAYDRRHGYRGPLRRIHIAGTPEDEDEQPVLTEPVDTNDIVEDKSAKLSELDKALKEIPKVSELKPAVVTSVQEQEAQIYLGNMNEALLDWQGLKWARPYINDNKLGPAPKLAEDILKPGDIIYVRAVDLPTEVQTTKDSQYWQLAQIPTVAGALVAIKPKDGAITAVVGGFNYYQSKFNRAIQAQRQPGSNFKPFIYSAALNKGFTTATLINDAPVVFEDPALENTWRPENYSGKFFGPTRLREALVNSRNLVSIRLLRAIGIQYAIDYISRFGFPALALPRNLSLALGSGSVTPLQLASAYTAFANGGFRVQPHFISRIESSNGEILYQINPPTACVPCEKEIADSLPTQDTEILDQSQIAESSPDSAEGSPGDQQGDELNTQIPTRLAERILDPQNVYLTYSLMRDVIKRGTGRRANKLGRNDLAGKTGTTNEQRDAWFSGFNSDLVATVWVGFDRVRSLGSRETGGRAALPMWIEFMGKVLKGKPEAPLEQPPGLVTVRIDAETGLLADSDTPNAIFEIFRSDQIPKLLAENEKSGSTNGATGNKQNVPEQIF